MDKRIAHNDIWQLDQLRSLTFHTSRSRFPKSLKALEFKTSNDYPPIDFSQMPNLNLLLFFDRNVTKQEILITQSLKSLSFEECIYLKDIYLYLTVKEFIMHESRKEDFTSRNITLWIGRGVSIPKVTVFC